MPKLWHRHFCRLTFKHTIMLHARLIKQTAKRIADVLKKEAKEVSTKTTVNQDNGFKYTHSTYVMNHRKWNLVERNDRVALIGVGGITLHNNPVNYLDELERLNRLITNEVLHSAI